MRTLIFLSFRYATILYYLNDVEDGGETAFPVADNDTFDKKVTLTLSTLQNRRSGPGKRENAVFTDTFKLKHRNLQFGDVKGPLVAY